MQEDVLQAYAKSLEDEAIKMSMAAVIAPALFGNSLPRQKRDGESALNKLGWQSEGKIEHRPGLWQDESTK